MLYAHTSNLKNILIDNLQLAALRFLFDNTENYATYRCPISREGLNLGPLIRGTCPATRAHPLIRADKRAARLSRVRPIFVSNK